MITLRDMNGSSEGKYNISPERMEKLINIFNNISHSSTGKTQKKMNDTDIDNLIKKKQDESDIKKALFHLDAETKVRPIMSYKPFEKQRYNLPGKYQKADSDQGSSYLLRYENDVKSSPRWMLNKEVDEYSPEKKPEEDNRK
jgi:hypothetical protein